MKREPEKAALASRQDSCRYVEEWRREHRAVPDDLDYSALLDDQEPAAAVARVRDLDRAR